MSEGLGFGLGPLRDLLHSQGCSEVRRAVAGPLQVCPSPTVSSESKHEGKLGGSSQFWGPCLL